MTAGTARPVVLAGLGRHADKIVIPALQASPNWHIAGLVSGRPEVAAQRADELGSAAFPSLTAAIEATGAGAVYLAGMPVSHLSDCREALEAGVPLVICEKPLGVNGGEVAALLEEAAGAGALLYEVAAYQHHPQFETLQRLIDSPEVGGLVHGYARFSYPFMPEGDFRYRPADGGGALLDAGIYPLSMAARLLGGEDVEIQAAEFRGDHDVDTAGSATLSDRRGRSFQCSWGMGSAYANVARIVGAAGTVEVPRPFSKPAAFTEPMVLIGGWGERTPVEYDAADQFVRMLDDLHLHGDDGEWRSAAMRQIADRWSVVERVRTTAIRVG